MCPLCGDQGVFRLDYADPPPDLIVCVCRAGQMARQPGRSWPDVRALLAARFKVALECVQLAEDALEPDDWPEGMGTRMTLVPGAQGADFTAAGKTSAKKARL